MKTVRDNYPNISDDLFQKATDWVGLEYSYVPYMEPARDGFISGYQAAVFELNSIIDEMKNTNPEFEKVFKKRFKDILA
jgi:hypothetical protein